VGDCREGDEGRHAVRSLRVREGDIIEVCDGQGCLVQASITTVDRPGSRAWAQPTSPVTQVPPPAPNWVLAAACTTLKGGRADWLVEKATELGAGELIPLITTRWGYE
jgi:16S rRNA (uracil1498-N3)-methyltransferase